MKTRNIITIISAILTMTIMSCSTEDDVLSEIGNQTIPSEQSAAVISCHVDGGVATKSTSFGEGSSQDADADEQRISNVIFFLIKNNNVIAVQSVASGNFHETTIDTKQQDGLSILAVCNLSETTFNRLKGATSRTEIEQQMLTDWDFRYLVKTGEKQINAADFKETAGKLIATAAIPVAHVAARIDLASLKINVKAADEVKLISVDLKNINRKGRLDKVAQALDTQDEKTLIPEADQANRLFTNAATFYSFANNDATHTTTMVLNLVIDGDNMTREFEIKHNGDMNKYIVGGYLYKLDVTVNVTGKIVEPIVTFEVAPWKRSEISADMEEINRVK